MIGPMGAGKSTVGKLLAEALGLKIVVYTEGKTPAETRDNVLAAIAEKA